MQKITTVAEWLTRRLGSPVHIRTHEELGTATHGTPATPDNTIISGVGWSDGVLTK